MRKFITGILCLFIVSSVFAQNESKELSSLMKEVSMLQTSQNRLKNEVVVLTNKNRKAESRISTLEATNKEINSKLESLQIAYDALASNQKADKTELSASINQTNDKVQATEDILSSRTIWGISGIVLVLIALAATIWAFFQKIKSGSSSIDGVRRAQDSLEKAQEDMRKAQAKMQEESIQLDNKLIEILSKQSSSITLSTSENGEIDHSLTLKVADEIVKIEMNLARMDESIKGYKQLAKGVQRIKDNFKANDYEIVDMLGKPYQVGMKAAVTFVTDENLEPGQQIISRIIKPQVNYKQVMIQAAQIEVSQAE